MDNNVENKEKIETNNIRTMIIIIFAIIAVIVTGTFAWLTYRSPNTAMVLTIGEIDGMSVTLKPYQVTASLTPTNDYTTQKYVNVTAQNKRPTSEKFRLYYQIESIDSNLIDDGFKYTIVKSTNNWSSQTTVKTGNFSSAASGQELEIYSEIVPGNNTTYQYKVYLWIDNSDSNQAQMQGKIFKGELRAEMLGHMVTLDPNGGTVSSNTIRVTTGGTYGTLPVPSRPGYTFVGWQGKNLVNDNAIRNYNNWNYSLVTTGSHPTNSSNPGFLLNLEAGKTYTLIYTTPSQSEFPAYLYLCKIVSGSGSLVAYLTTNSITTLNYTFTVAAGETYFLRIQAGDQSQFNTNIAKLSSIQIEEGNTATEYENNPITSSTTVVQNKDHALTAIWQAN